MEVHKVTLAHGMATTSHHGDWQGEVGVWSLVRQCWLSCSFKFECMPFRCGCERSTTERLAHHLSDHPHSLTLLN